jgi:import inner membrane translocase subunit TIM10
MANVCSKKCLVKYPNPELEIGEMTCIDRCVGKYMQAGEKVGEVLKEFEQKIKAQENMMPSGMHKFGPQVK